MKNKENNYAYIDGANLHNGVRTLHFDLDYRRFRVWLTEKYSVSRAYIFIGYIPKYNDLYSTLQRAGFTLIFKETIYDASGKAKGNCDADLVLRSVIDIFEADYTGSVLVSSDGDYASLVKFLMQRGKMKVVLSTHAEEKCSILLKRTGAPITSIGDVRNFVMVQKEKAPDADRTA